MKIENNSVIIKPIAAYHAAAVQNINLNNLWKYSEAFAKKVMSAKVSSSKPRQWGEEQFLTSLREVFLYPEKPLYKIAIANGMGRTALAMWSLKFEKKHTEFRE